MEDVDKKIIQQRLKDRRLLMNMTYEELGRKTNLSKSTLQRYETGKIGNLPIDNIFKISEALAVDPNYFVDIHYDEKSTIAPFKHFSSAERSLFIKENEILRDISIRILTPDLITKGYTIEFAKSSTIGNLIAQKGKEVWIFKFIHRCAIVSLTQIYGRIALYRKPITKYSIVTDEEETADFLCKNPPINLNVKTSIVLVNEDTKSYKEFILS